MLTGDKRQTAISIGVACKLMPNPTQVLILEGDSVGQVLDNINKLDQKITEEGGFTARCMQ